MISRTPPDRCWSDVRLIAADTNVLPSEPPRDDSRSEEEADLLDELADLLDELADLDEELDEAESSEDSIEVTSFLFRGLDFLTGSVDDSGGLVFLASRDLDFLTGSSEMMEVIVILL